MVDRKGRFDGVLCAIVMAACVLAARPFAAMGFIDDWSYARTAQIFAETGHFVYNGWATAMLGWQIWWGALFIKLFGFSFTALRMSTLPIAMVTVCLFHQILVRCGVKRWNAVVGALTVALCPLFLVLTASYMSDIPGLFCIVLCLYLCLRALQAGSDGATLLWLVAAAVTNAAGGTVRQVAWLGVLVIVPSMAWLLRRRRGAMVAGLLLWSLSVAFIFLCLHWFKHQPYSVPETFLAHSLNVRSFIHLASQCVKAFLCLGLITLPILAAWLPAASRYSWRRRAGILLVLVTLAVLWSVMPRDDGGDSLMMPWVTHLFSSMGTWTTGDNFGVKPVNLGVPARIVISLAVVAAMLAFLMDLWSYFQRARRQGGVGTGQDGATVVGELSWVELFWLLGPFCLSYIALIVFRALFLHISIFDRYLLPLLAVNAILMLRYYQQEFSEKLPSVTLWVVAIFALYGVGGLHDWYSLQRARVAAADEIRASGVPRTAIWDGFEYNGWTQITVAGHINNEIFRKPGDEVKPGEYDSNLPAECYSWLNPYTSVVKPGYYVVYSELPCFAPSSFAPVSYGAWLPPFHRELYIQQRRYK
jgi:hypothetical protein